MNLVTGEVVFFSDYLGTSDEDERLLEDIDGSTNHVAIERIPSPVAYQWMVAFVDELVAPADEQAAEKLSLALHGKGAFRRFKDMLHGLDDQWPQAWYHWRNERLEAAVDEWLKSILLEKENKLAPYMIALHLQVHAFNVIEVGPKIVTASLEPRKVRKVRPRLYKRLRYVAIREELIDGACVRHSGCNFRLLQGTPQGHSKKPTCVNWHAPWVKVTVHCHKGAQPDSLTGKPLSQPGTPDTQLSAPSS